MNAKIIEIVFKDTPSRANKELIDYLKRNLETAIIKGNLRFKFHIAKEHDTKKLLNRGIKRLPAMLINKNDITIGTDAIINGIIQMVKNSRTPSKLKNNDEILNDYFQNAIGSNVSKNDEGKFVLDDNGEDTEQGIDLGALHAKELARRKMNNPNNNAPDEDDDDEFSFKKKKKRDIVPSKPSRDVLFDDEEIEEAPRAQRPAPRKDNITDGIQGAKIALKKISGSGNKQDDDMMAQLLDKIGSDM